MIKPKIFSCSTKKRYAIYYKGEQLKDFIFVKKESAMYMVKNYFNKDYVVKEIIT